jgi:hypothetical protein
MKRPVIYFALLIMALAAGSSGCKKSNSFDSTKAVQTDFVGTWQGAISTFRHNTTISYTGTFLIYASSSGYTLQGLLNMAEVNIVQQTQFNNGTFYFKLICNSPDDPECQNWTLAGFATLVEQGRMQLHIAGNECGSVGDQYVDFSGVLTQISTSIDSSFFYTFGKSGNTWNYKITKVNNDTCTTQDIITGTAVPGVFQGQDLNSCGWQPPSANFFWYVDPLYFQVMQELSSGAVVASFPIGAHLSYNYHTVYNGDTTDVMLMATNISITVPSGTYQCREFKVTSKIHSAAVLLPSGYYYLNNQAGIVKYEPLITTALTDVSKKELTGKNF